jgi:flagellar biosynthesis regulator FlaF
LSIDGNWIIGNLKHSGFYRVNYDDKNWILLIDQLRQNHKAIEKTARAQLIDDSFNLGRAEIIDQLEFFKLTR